MVCAGTTLSEDGVGAALREGQGATTKARLPLAERPKIAIGGAGSDDRIALADRRRPAYASARVTFPCGVMVCAGTTLSALSVGAGTVPQ